jgi:hypothetical protein
VNDVVQSPAALGNIFAHARPGAMVAAVGGKWAPAWAVGLNTLAANIHAPFIRNFTGFHRPWAHLVDHLVDVRIHEIEMGCGYLAAGTTRDDAAPGRTNLRLDSVGGVR